MWENVSKISGLPPFRTEGRRDDVSIADQRHVAKIELEEALKRLDSTRSELSDVKTCHLELVETQLQLGDAQSQLLALQENNDQLSAAVTTLETENSQLTKDINQLSTNFSVKEDELAHLTDENCGLKQVAEKQGNEIRDLKEKATKQAAEEARLQNELYESKQEIQHLTTRNKSLEADKQKVEVRQSETYATMRTQESEYKTCKKELSAVKSELEELQQQLAQSEQHKQDAQILVKKSKEDATKVVKEMTAKIDAVRSELQHAYNIELESIACDLIRANKEVSRMTTKFEQCSKDQQVAEKKNSELSIQIQKTNADLEEEARQCEQLQVELKECNRNKERLQNDVHLIKEKLSSAESRIEAAETAHQAGMEKLRRQLADAKKAAEADRHRHESLLKEMEDRFISFVRDVFRHNH